MKPYDFQIDVIDRTRASVLEHRRSLMVMPTGAGKTVCSGYMMSQSAMKGKAAYYVAHRHELLDGICKSLDAADLEYSRILPGRKFTPGPVTVGTVLTMGNRDLPAPDFLIVDEAHRSAAASYLKLFRRWPETYVVGLTATPQRTDGQGLGPEPYRDIVEGPSMPWLIENGYLSRYCIFAPPSDLNLRGIGSSGGDFVRSQAGERVIQSRIVGDAPKLYRQHVDGKRAMVFTVSVKHAQASLNAFRAADIPTELIEGRMSTQTRRGVLGRFEDGETKVLVSIDLCIEGLDIPAIEAAFIQRPTQSLIVHLQTIGRTLRTAPGKEEAVLFDQVSNYLRHGLPDDERTWKLEGREKKKRESDRLDIRQCEQCFRVVRAGSRCPDERPDCPLAAKDGRIPKQVDGELVKLDLEKARMERQIQEKNARDYSELLELGIKRGYKHPQYWAFKKARERRKKRR